MCIFWGFDISWYLQQNMLPIKIFSELFIEDPNGKSYCGIAEKSFEWGIQFSIMQCTVFIWENKKFQI